MNYLLNKVFPLIIGSESECFWEICLVYRNFKAHRKVEDLFWRLGCIIVYLEANWERSDRVVVKGIVEASMSKISPSRIEELLKEIDDIIDVKIKESPLKGVGVYVNYYPPVMADIPLIILREKQFVNITNSLKRKLGTAGETILYYIGEMAGREAYETYSSLFNLKGREVFNFVAILARNYGWWREVELVDFKSNVVIVRIYDLVECKYMKSDRPNSQYFRGFLSGFFSKFFNVDVVEEQYCVAMGDSYCEFHLFTRDMKNFVSHEVTVL